MSLQYDSLQPASEFASTDSSDSLHTWLLHFLPAPPNRLFNANPYRTCSSTGSLLLCKKDLSPFTCSCVIYEIRCICSLSTNCADPLLKNRFFRSKTTLVHPYMSVSLCVCNICMCMQREWENFVMIWVDSVGFATNIISHRAAETEILTYE